MRIKNFYTPDEVTNNLYTFGKEYMTEDYTEYIGGYHTYNTGEIYTEFKWNKNMSVKLFDYVELNDNIKTYKDITNVETEYASFNTINISISNRQIKQGVVTRYIIKKRNELVFYEVSKETYDEWKFKKIDPVLYNAVTINWIISGDIQDNVVKGVSTPGVITKNLNSINRLEKQMPGLSVYLNDPLQYYIDNDIVISTDINGLDS